MIERYSRAEMARIWSEKNKYLKWLEVEWEVCRAMASQGLISRKDWAELNRGIEKLHKKGGVDPDRVNEIERATRHDLIAFTTAVAEKIGATSRYVHFGLTSSDVVDTGLSLQLKEAGAILLKDIVALIAALHKSAVKYRGLATIGRSHGIFAEPTSFGLKFLSWELEWKRNHARLELALEGVRVGKLSGAVGVNPHYGPEFEAKVLGKLGLGREGVSTQVIPRDRLAELMNAIALAGASMERIAIELRHLQRSEVAEVMEGFKKGQKGSSAMPHKRNPISSENLTGCARMLRSYSQATLENVALWHERDISHSSVERIAVPDAFILFDYSLVRLTDLISGLVVREDRVRKNLEAAGTLVYSGHYLLALVEKGATREEAYAWIQECALKSLEEKKDFVSLLSKHPEVLSRLGKKAIAELGSIKYQLRHVREIYSQAAARD